MFAQNLSNILSKNLSFGVDAVCEVKITNSNHERKLLAQFPPPHKVIAMKNPEIAEHGSAATALHETSTNLFDDAFTNMKQGVSGVGQLLKGTCQAGLGLALKQVELEVKAVDYGTYAAKVAANGAKDLVVGAVDLQIAAWSAVGGAIVDGAVAVGGAAAATGKEFVRENPELMASGKVIADGVSTLAKRDSEFHKDRPMNAAMTQVFGLDHLVGMMAGGLPDATTKAAMPGVDTPKVRAEPNTSDVPKTVADQTVSLETVAAKSGDSYWRIAERQLGAGASNAKILAATIELQNLNGNKAIAPGMSIALTKATT
ncbi:hypothetical protein BH11CYA1_BH11CYA1_50090 [soil metagenome]